MAELKETRKYIFTVEGDTEKYYLEWLKEQINNCDTAEYKASIVSKVQQSPSKFVKSQTTFELWMILHKNNCNAALTDRKQYLQLLNRA